MTYIIYYAGSKNIHNNLTMCAYMLSHVRLFVTPWTVACQPPLFLEFSSKEFSSEEYWNGLLFSTLGDFPDPQIEPTSLASPALAGRLFTTAPPEEPQ